MTSKIKMLCWVTVYIAFTVAWCLFRNHPSIAVENGPMEDYQALLLLAGVIVLAIAFKRSDVKGEQVLMAGLGLFYFTVLLLEVDTRQSGHPLLIKLTNGKIRNLWAGTLWLLAAIYFFRNARITLKYFSSWILSPPGLILMAGGINWAMSEFLEHAFHVGFFWEELPECVGATLMIHSAFLALGVIQRRQKSFTSDSTPKNI